MKPTGLHAVQLAPLMAVVPFTVVVAAVVDKVAEEDLEPRGRRRIGAELGALADQIGPIAHSHNRKVVVCFMNPLVLYFQEFVC